MKKITGFTLIELLVVLAIIAILVTLATPRYIQHIDRSKHVVLQENLATLRTTLEQYNADTGQWPKSLDELVERKYLRAVPIDPITERTDTWLTYPAGSGEEGIAEIRSGAEGEDANGIPYSDW
jgi:general secretion pathway protein G